MRNYELIKVRNKTTYKQRHEYDQQSAGFKTGQLTEKSIKNEIGENKV